MKERNSLVYLAIIIGLILALVLTILYARRDLQRRLSNAAQFELGDQYPEQESPFEVIVSDQFEGVIFPKEKAGEVLKQCSRPTPQADGYWDVTKEDILKLERALPDYAKLNSPKHCEDLVQKLSLYKRQYVGIIVQGRKIIYVNTLLPNEYSGRSWKMEPEMVCDGGCDFWGVEFDVESGQFSNLYSNGEA